jgi:hypothetical protein
LVIVSEVIVSEVEILVTNIFRNFRKFNYNNFRKFSGVIAVKITVKTKII